MRALYNEIDPFCCDWLSNLMDAGLITPGKIDQRPVQELSPDDVRGYERVHFFAGIAGWDHALNLAGWGNECLWTGSCPCQPFSTASANRRGFDDERHLWPYWRDLIDQCRPPVIFGEQVARASAWLAMVRRDLERLGYAVGAIPIEAASCGANHLRDRLWFVADYGGKGLSVSQQEAIQAARRGYQGRATPQRDWWAAEPGVGCTFYGLPGRVGQLRALGNSIVPQVAAEFIGAFCDAA